MNMPSLTDELFSKLQGAPIQQLSQQLGVDSAQASSAIGAALPLLLGTLGRNAAQPDGAEALFGALQRDHSGNAGDLLGAALSGGGNSILGHIFGAKQSRAAEGLSQVTGIDGAQAGKLLAMLAPIVLSFLANRSSQQGLDASGLSRMLSQGTQPAQASGGVGNSLLTAVLDQDGDGQLGLGDLLKLGGNLMSGGKR